MRFSQFQLTTLDNGHAFEFLIVSCRLQDTSGCKASCKARRAGTCAVLLDDVRGVPKPSSNNSS